MTALKRQCGTREENRDEEKQHRKGEGTDWDCGSGIKLPICILLGMTERKRGNMTNLHEKVDRG